SRLRRSRGWRGLNKILKLDVEAVVYVFGNGLYRRCVRCLDVNTIGLVIRTEEESQYIIASLLKYDFHFRFIQAVGRQRLRRINDFLGAIELHCVQETNNIIRLQFLSVRRFPVGPILLYSERIRAPMN